MVRESSILSHFQRKENSLFKVLASKRLISLMMAEIDAVHKSSQRMKLCLTHFPFLLGCRSLSKVCYLLLFVVES